jgi:Xaa-Pro aminopeptidase
MTRSMHPIPESPTDSISTDRITAIRQTLTAKKLNALLVTGVVNIRYLTGFSGSNATLVVMQDAVHFLTDGRYATQIATELAPFSRTCAELGTELHIHITREPFKVLGESNLLQGCQHLGFEAARMSFASVQSMRKTLWKTLRKSLPLLRLMPTTGIVEATTVVKTVSELASIRAAVRCAEQVYEYVLNFAKPGMRESELAAEVSYQARKLGSEGDAFDIIVASGERGGLPHGRASEKIMQRGELVTLDFGCIVTGFNSDMTRTFALGTPSDLARRVYGIVLEANKRAIGGIRGGMTAKRVDALARDVISAAGYGEQFEHSLGHGLGLDVHEAPALSYRYPRLRVPAGAVVTIEPGVYLPNECGVRIEDNVVVGTDGCEVLTRNAPKELIIL